MEQLTQVELLHLEELLSMEALAIKKYKSYAKNCREKEMVPLFEEAVEMHRKHLQGLLDQMRNHNGKEPMKH